MASRLIYVWAHCIVAAVLVGCKDTQLADFQQWCSEREIDIVNVAPAQVPELERGVVASRDLRAGTRILSIPISAMITPDTALTHLRSVLPNTELDGMTETNKMAAALLLWDNDRTSPWRAYLDVLPRKFSTPLFWNSTELALLQSSVVAAFAQKKNEAIRRQYDGVISPLCNHDERFCTGAFGFDRFKWALSVLWSRSFSVQIGGKAMGALVPMADFFNTATPDRINAQHRMTSTALEFVTTRPVASGKQIFVQYGSDFMSNGQLLLEYGFVLPDAPVKMMMLPRTEIVPPDPIFEPKTRLLKQLGLDGPYVPLRNDSSGIDVTPVVIIGRVAALTEAEHDRLLLLVDGQQVDARSMLRPIAPDHENRTMMGVSRQLSYMLETYATPLDFDQRLLRNQDRLRRAAAASPSSASSSGSQQQRQKPGADEAQRQMTAVELAAVRLRTEEKLLLSAALAKVEKDRDAMPDDYQLQQDDARSLSATADAKGRHKSENKRKSSRAPKRP